MGLLSWLRTQRVAIAYGGASFSSALLHSVFISYYVALFVSVYNLSERAFYFGELVFMAWNSINDPLAGLLIQRGEGEAESELEKTVDSKGNRRAASGLLDSFRSRITQNRLRMLRLGGLGWVLSFLWLFFPGFNTSVAENSWAPWLVPLHFALSLCVYDGLLSFTTVIHSSLLADLTTSSSERVRLNSASSIMSVIGSNSLLLSHIFWNPTGDLSSFRLYCIALAILAAFGFHMSSSWIAPNRRSISPADMFDDSVILAVEGGRADGPNRKKSPVKRPGVLVFLRQLCGQSNFWWFVLLGVVQVLNCHFNSNFMTVFLDTMLRHHNESPAWLVPVILSISTTAPHLVVVLLAPFVQRVSLYSVVQGLLVFKLALALTAWVVGPERLFVVLAFMLANKVFNEAICRHSGLIIADLIDEDVYLNDRTTSMSTLLYGLTQFFTRPGQSVAPMLGWHLLRRAGHLSTVVGGNGMSSGDILVPEGTEISAAVAVSSEVYEYVFDIAVLVPMACAAWQLLVWSRFSLRGEYLTAVQKRRTEKDGDR